MQIRATSYRQFILSIGVVLAMGWATESRSEPHYYGRVVALCIGIDSYQSDNIRTLNLAESDARGFAEVCQQYYGYLPDLLVGKDATKGAIEAKLRYYNEQLGEKDALIIFFAGHGHSFVVKTEDDFVPTRTGYILPYGANVNLDAATQFLTSSSVLKQWEHDAINMQLLVDQISAMNAGHVLIFADCCCSGFMTKRGPAEKPQILSLMRGTSRTVFTATTQKQGASEGVFTKSLERQLRRLHKDREVASVTDLFQYVLPEVSGDPGHRPMTPQMAHVGAGDGEFLFFPSSIPKASIEALKEAMASATVDNNKLALLEGVIDRSKKRAGLRTTISDVLAALQAPSYWYGENAAEATEHWREIRETFDANAAWGDALAMVALHYCYSRGIGEPQPTKDFDSAYHWALSARYVENPPGVGDFLLGRCYRYGMGVSRNSETAARLYQESARKGFVLGEFGLATILAGRAANSQEVKEAVRLYEKCASAGMASASTQLAAIYARGDMPGIPQDLSRAIGLYKTGAEMGDPVAMHELATAYADGSPGFPPKDLALAERHVRKAAGLAFAASQHWLAVEYYGGKGCRLNIAQDLDRAKSLAELAAAQGHNPAQMLLTDMYEKGMAGPVDYEKARQYCEAAGAANHPPAIYQQGLWYAQGKVYDPNDGRALALFLRAAAMKSADACRMAGAFYEDVRGVTIPQGVPYVEMKRHYMPDALHWYIQAVKLGQDAFATQQLQVFAKDFRAQRQAMNSGSRLAQSMAPSWPSGIMDSWKQRHPKSAEYFQETFLKTSDGTNGDAGTPRK